MNTVKTIKDEDFIGYPTWQVLVNHLYAANPIGLNILITHSKAVANFALGINSNKKIGLPPSQIEYAAMVHDIGICKTDAPIISCFGPQPYIRHGVLGADILREFKAPEWAARVCERHTGAGIYPSDINNQNLPLPIDRVLFPKTILEKLICYADKFFSKNPISKNITPGVPKDLKTVLNNMSKHGHESLQRFMALHKLFN